MPCFTWATWTGSALYFRYEDGSLEVFKWSFYLHMEKKRLLQISHLWPGLVSYSGGFMGCMGRQWAAWNSIWSAASPPHAPRATLQWLQPPCSPSGTEVFGTGGRCILCWNSLSLADLQGARQCWFTGFSFCLVSFVFCLFCLVQFFFPQIFMFKFLRLHFYLFY